ncbi:MAG: acetyltransferase [Nitritalea sp.]
MEKPVIILGASGIARPALSIFTQNNIVVYGFLEEDTSQHGLEIGEVSVLGHTEDDGFLKLIGKKCEAFVAVDDLKYRKFLVKMLHEKRKMQPVNAIHPAALIAPDAAIGHGNFINAGVLIGQGAELGSHCMLHSRVVVEHACVIGDYVQVGVGALINAGVRIEEDAFIGSGVIVVSGVTIGKGARVGAGSVVISDVKAGQTVFGNPAVPVKA